MTVIVCTYDNPATWMRECWQDGKMICAYSFEILNAKPPIPAHAFFFGANVGIVQEGRVWGNPKAMEVKS